MVSGGLARSAAVPSINPREVFSRPRKGPAARARPGSAPPPSDRSRQGYRTVPRRRHPRDTGPAPWRNRRRASLAAAPVRRCRPHRWRSGLRRYRPSSANQPASARVSPSGDANSAAPAPAPARRDECPAEASSGRRDPSDPPRGRFRDAPRRVPARPARKSSSAVTRLSRAARGRRPASAAPP